MRPVEISWPGGEHSFLLRVGQLRALQTKCDAGPAYILGRLASGQWLVDDVIQTIRLGLEGGGMDRASAWKVVEQHVENEPPAKFIPTARAILMLSIYGDEADDDPVGEPSAGETENSNQLSRGERSDGRVSTEPALLSE